MLVESLVRTSLAFGWGLIGRGLVDHQSVVPNLCLFACVRSMLACFFHPVIRNDDLEGVSDHSHFEVPIAVSRAAQRWRRVDFDEPWLELVIEQHIVSVNFIAVLVVDHDTLHRLV